MKKIIYTIVFPLLIISGSGIKAQNCADPAYIYSFTYADANKVYFQSNKHRCKIHKKWKATDYSIRNKQHRLNKPCQFKLMV
jgi:hypothetical protein